MAKPHTEVTWTIQIMIAFSRKMIKQGSLLANKNTRKVKDYKLATGSPTNKSINCNPVEN